MFPLAGWDVLPPQPLRSFFFPRRSFKFSFLFFALLRAALSSVSFDRLVLLHLQRLQILVALYARFQFISQKISFIGGGSCPRPVFQVLRLYFALVLD